MEATAKCQSHPIQGRASAKRDAVAQSPVIAVTVQLEETPEWVRETPYECAYELQMSDSDGAGVQTVSLTRDEFEDLKLHLATKRGYAISLPYEFAFAK